MRKFLTIAIPIVSITLFILVMLSDNFLKKPLTNNDDIPASINLIIKDIEEERWSEARDKTDQLSNSWQKVVKRVQFSAEKDEINKFDMNIARLRGAIMAKDKSNAFIELSEAYEHWENLGK
ncbi:MAG: DUF4363 family protein [Sedimentibacter sp.]